jgi:hypothetical protein
MRVLFREIKKSEIVTNGLESERNREQKFHSIGFSLPMALFRLPNLPSLDFCY